MGSIKEPLSVMASDQKESQSLRKGQEYSQSYDSRPKNHITSGG